MFTFANFNSIKVQLKLGAHRRRLRGGADFNSIKVQLKLLQTL